MGEFEEITQDVLARARRDPAFRQQLLTSSLDRLLAALYKQQHKLAQKGAVSPQQLREGAQLAARLADLIRRLDDERAAAAEAEKRAAERMAAVTGQAKKT